MLCVEMAIGAVVALINEKGLQRWQTSAQKAKHVYHMQIAPDLIIDARHKGNVARRSNSWSPNCKTQNGRMQPLVRRLSLHNQSDSVFRVPYQARKVKRARSKYSV